MPLEADIAPVLDCRAATHFEGMTAWGDHLSLSCGRGAGFTSKGKNRGGPWTAPAHLVQAGLKPLPPTVPG